MYLVLSGNIAAREVSRYSVPAPIIICDGEHFISRNEYKYFDISFLRINSPPFSGYENTSMPSLYKISFIIFAYMVLGRCEVSIPFGLKTISSGAVVSHGIFPPYGEDLNDIMYPLRGIDIMYPVS